LFNRENIKKYIPGNLKASVRILSAQFNIGNLPQHPYQVQFDPEMDCPETDWAKRFFLIASTPRCGSHYIGHMLGETGECGVPLEYLHDGNLRYWARRFRTFRLDVLFSKIVQHRTSANGTFTLKAHWDQYKPHIGSMDGLTRGLGVEKIVWISRHNQLSQAISTVIAQQTGVWISGAKPVAEARFDYDAIVKVANSTRHANFQWRVPSELQPAVTSRLSLRAWVS
jgi:LPS sulfotransferase NodH